MIMSDAAREPVTVHIQANTTREGFVQQVFTRSDGSPIGDVTQVAAHRWQAHLAPEPLASATTHPSYEAAEQALMDHAGYSTETLKYV